MNAFLGVLPQLVYLIFAVASVVYSYQHRGEHSVVTENPLRAAVITLVGALLLAWGGFFDPLVALFSK